MRAIAADLWRSWTAVLADVRAAVHDWPKLQRALAADEAALPQGEGAALLQWFLDGHFTQIGHQNWHRDGSGGDALGIARNPHGTPILAEASRTLAIEWFEAGNDAPLLLKSSLISTVHRAVPLDLVLVPVMAAGKIEGLSIHAGLWTSAALTARPQRRAGAAQPACRAGGEVRVRSQGARRQGADACAGRAAARSGRRRSIPRLRWSGWR